jgi:phage FluMu protein Com
MGNNHSNTINYNDITISDFTDSSALKRVYLFRSMQRLQYQPMYQPMYQPQAISIPPVEQEPPVVEKQIKFLDIKCPVCRKMNKVDIKEHVIYGLTETCKVCLENEVKIHLPNCKHACLCEECCLAMDGK